jgi:hypothetical protein
VYPTVAAAGKLIVSSHYFGTGIFRYYRRGEKSHVIEDLPFAIGDIRGTALRAFGGIGQGNATAPGTLDCVFYYLYHL